MQQGGSNSAAEIVQEMVRYLGLLDDVLVGKTAVWASSWTTFLVTFAWQGPHAGFVRGGHKCWEPSFPRDSLSPPISCDLSPCTDPQVCGQPGTSQTVSFPVQGSSHVLGTDFYFLLWVGELR